jgi:hypothetical protein
MRSLLRAAMAVFLVSSAEAGAQHCIFRVHLEAKAQDGSVFAQPLRSFTGRSVFIEKMPWITERDVRKFYPYRAADGSYAALLQLDDHGRTVLDTLSVEHRGSYLYVFLNGRPLTEFQIDRRVSDGRIYLASGLTETDIKLMNKDWKLIGGKRRK